MGKRTRTEFRRGNYTPAKKVPNQLARSFASFHQLKPRSVVLIMHTQPTSSHFESDASSPNKFFLRWRKKKKETCKRKVVVNSQEGKNDETSGMRGLDLGASTFKVFTSHKTCVPIKCPGIRSKYQLWQHSSLLGQLFSARKGPKHSELSNSNHKEGRREGLCIHFKGLRGHRNPQTRTTISSGSSVARDEV